MTLTDRVRALRSASLEATATLSAERAALITAWYRDHDRDPVSTPVFRAQAFRHLLEHRSIWIGPGELIVGEKGPGPKQVPTFPELCCHSLEDLRILDSRAKVPYAVPAAVRDIYEHDIIPFWQGRSMRDRLFSQMTPEWKICYESGLFTEFMEQRSPGHTVADGRIYRVGMRQLQTQIHDHLARLDFLGDREAYAKQEELRAMDIVAEAIVRFAQRHAEKARQLAADETDVLRRTELERIAEICTRVPAEAPRDFHEALQAYWFVHLGVTQELNTWDSFSPGHLDQHLLPFYRRGLEARTLTRAGAEELLHCFWIKFNNQPAPPKVGVTAAESGTYTDFAQINTGGITPEGGDGVSELSYLLLDVIEDMRLLQPSSSCQISRRNPDRFIKRAGRIIRTGFGQPSLFNADLIVQELVRQGKTVEDARCGGSSGCVEVGVFGKEAFILHGYMNLPKVLELALHNGIDVRSGLRLGPATGEATAFNDYDALFAAYQTQLCHLVDTKVRASNCIERLYAVHLPSPFLSLLIDDCIAQGRDYHDGGARYNSSYLMGVGLGSMTDSLTALKVQVFERKSVTMRQMLDALALDFVGHEALRQTLINRTPKLGNDDDLADQVMQQVFASYLAAVDGRPNTRGGRYHINLLPTTAHVYFGSVMGAMPDGRKAGQPLSEGISPVQGADRKGPTAVLLSLAKLDHARTGGTLLNQKLSPQLLADDAGLDSLVQLVRSYFRLDGHHIQFNVVDVDTLRLAQREPEKHRDLIVRVAGYSDYFCDLSLALQEEIIARTEHQSTG